jgi:hypothetical protein
VLLVLAAALLHNMPVVALTVVDEGRLGCLGAVPIEDDTFLNNIEQETFSTFVRRSDRPQVYLIGN